VSYLEEALDTVQVGLDSVLTCIAGMPSVVVALASCNGEACRHRLEAYSLEERGSARGSHLLENRQLTRHQFHSHCRVQARAH